MNGIVFYDGPSRLNGYDILGIATGLVTPSHNRKTGAMAQTWILNKHHDPVEANALSLDRANCGSCLLRGLGTNGKRTCYVNLGQAPLSIWRAYQAGRYPFVPLDDLSTHGQHRYIRLGAYGDPAAIPIQYWDALLSKAKGWTGYTHQWANPRYREVLKYCMASCETEADAVAAHALGAGTFRILPDDLPALGSEVACPFGTVPNLTCQTCLRCDGSEGMHVTVTPHGAGAKALVALVRASSSESS